MIRSSDHNYILGIKRAPSSTFSHILRFIFAVICAILLEMEDSFYQNLASELIRALRGRRSQTAFSRRLGYKCNVVYTWESGRRRPTAAQFFRILQRVGVDVRAALERFYRAAPQWLERVDLTGAPAVALMLDDLRGGAGIGDLAHRTGRSRFAVSRWLKGDAEPRLPDFLRMIEATSLRLLDFVAALVDPSQLPSVADKWIRLQTARTAAYEMPWSHVVLRALELEQYRAMTRHQTGWIAQHLGISIREERRCLRMLAKTGQIEKRNGRWVPGAVLTVDTRHDPRRDKKLKAWWSRLAARRIKEESPGFFSYNLFTVSEKDLQRLEELHLVYYRELRSIVAESEPSQRVVLANLQLFGLEA